MADADSHNKDDTIDNKLMVQPKEARKVQEEIAKEYIQLMSDQRKVIQSHAEAHEAGKEELERHYISLTEGKAKPTDPRNLIHSSIWVYARKLIGAVHSKDFAEALDQRLKQVEKDYKPDPKGNVLGTDLDSVKLGWMQTTVWNYLHIDLMGKENKEHINEGFTDVENAKHSIDAIFGNPIVTGVPYGRLLELKKAAAFDNATPAQLKAWVEALINSEYKDRFEIKRPELLGQVNQTNIDSLVRGIVSTNEDNQGKFEMNTLKRYGLAIRPEYINTLREAYEKKQREQDASQQAAQAQADANQQQAPGKSGAPAAGAQTAAPTPQESYGKRTSKPEAQANQATTAQPSQPPKAAEPAQAGAAPANTAEPYKAH